MTRRWPLYAIMTMFALPMLMAGVLFLSPHTFHLTSLNRGTLMSPMPVVANPARHWQVIYVPASAVAGEEHQLHQMHKLLGENARRVMVEQRKTFLGLPAGHIWLVDPHGNVFMSYPQSVNPMDILHDLKRVLSVSRVG